MKVYDFSIWYKIDNGHGTPICSFNQGIQISQYEMAIPNISLIDVASKEGGRFQLIINDDIYYDERMVILPTTNHLDIDKFIQSNSFDDKRNEIYQCVCLINEHIGNLLSIDPDWLYDLKHYHKDEEQLKSVITNYTTRYVPNGNTLSEAELISISFKFSNPNKTYTLKNFVVGSYIMDCLRKHYNFDASFEFSKENSMLVFKKIISKWLFNFFRLPNTRWYIHSKNKIYSIIEEIFRLAEVEASSDAIQKWIKEAN